jgi:hypothetical protein
MIWLTWRQHRRQLLFTVLGLAALAAFIVPTGIAMHNAFADKGIAACMAATRPSEACDLAIRQFRDQYSSLSVVGVLLLLVPLLVGLFWGAPLVAREVEHGTHRLIWTQGVSRREWALVKFGFVGLATVALASIYGFGISWWLTPLSQIGDMSRFDPLLFDMQGVVPIGYTLFAVALGVFAGTLWPRMLPAMGLTLAGFVGVRVAVALLARPNYLAPLTVTSPLQSDQPIGNGISDWVINTGIRDASGNMIASHAQIVCGASPDGPGKGCGVELGIGPGAYNWEQYQPASRFWLFQGIETSLFAVLALALLFFAVRRIRRLS